MQELNLEFFEMIALEKGCDIAFPLKWNIGADYAISKKMAVGLNAGYMLDNDHDDPVIPDTHSGYKLGVDFTVEF